VVHPDVTQVSKDKIKVVTSKYNSKSPLSSRSNGRGGIYSSMKRHPTDVGPDGWEIEDSNMI